MRILGVLFAGLAMLSFAPWGASAQFAAGHADPRRANPPAERPNVRPCVIEVVNHGFRNFDPARGRIDAPAQCPGPWQKIVLELRGKVKGRQYDRIGHLQIGGVTIFRTSTPEPSPEGISWTVEKDVTGYAPLFAQPQELEMHLGNLVNETYTGVFDVQVRILFYPAVQGQALGPASGASDRVADIVVPLSDLRHVGAETVGKVRLPANAERLILEVYATGSGGGCEEFWYYAAPKAKAFGDYWCKAELGPYREVQVLVDGQVAGIAAPYPHIYTGGWSNPILWYQIPAPRAFDIHPIRFELTPFVGRINDGRAHEVRLRVLGVPEGSEGWALHPNVQVWRDSGNAATKGELLRAELTPLELDHSPRTGGGRTGFDSRAQHRFVARGVLRTSRGTVETIVERSLSTTLAHSWLADDRHDGLRGDWTDRQTVTRRAGAAWPKVETHTQRFGLEGAIDTVRLEGVKDAARLTTTLSIYDDAEWRSSDGERVSAWQQTSDRFDGSASYNRGVPRERRQAASATRQEYLRRDRSGNCYRHVLRARDGQFVEDRSYCVGGSQGAPSTADETEAQ